MMMYKWKAWWHEEGQKMALLKRTNVAPNLGQRRKILKVITVIRKGTLEDCSKHKMKDMNDKSSNIVIVAEDESDYHTASSIIANNVCLHDEWILDLGCFNYVSQ